MPAESLANCATVDLELDRQFGAGERPLSEAARRHLEDCERCRGLCGWIEGATEHPYASREVYERIQAALKSSLRPVSPRPSTRVLALEFLAVFLIFAIPAITMMGVEGFRQMTVGQVAGMSAALILGAALLSLSLAWQAIPGSLQRFPAKGLVAILAVGFFLGAAILFPWNGTEAFLTRGLHCFKGGLLMALPAMAAFWLVVRRGAALDIVTLGVTLGAIAGLTSLTVLQLACDRQDLAHLLVWHGGVLVTSVVFGAGVAIAKRSPRMAADGRG